MPTFELTIYSHCPNNVVCLSKKNDKFLPIVLKPFLKSTFFLFLTLNIIVTGI